MDFDTSIKVIEGLKELYLVKNENLTNKLDDTLAQILYTVPMNSATRKILYQDLKSYTKVVDILYKL